MFFLLIFCRVINASSRRRYCNKPEEDCRRWFLGSKSVMSSLEFRLKDQLFCTFIVIVLEVYYFKSTSGTVAALTDFPFSFFILISNNFADLKLLTSVPIGSARQ